MPIVTPKKPAKPSRPMGGAGSAPSRPAMAPSRPVAPARPQMAAPVAKPAPPAGNMVSSGIPPRPRPQMGGNPGMQAQPRPMGPPQMAPNPGLQSPLAGQRFLPPGSVRANAMRAAMEARAAQNAQMEVPLGMPQEIGPGEMGPPPMESLNPFGGGIAPMDEAIGGPGAMGMDPRLQAMMMNRRQGMM